MNILTKPHEDGSDRTQLDWNKVVDLGTKLIGLLTLALTVYCVKHGINTDAKVDKVEHTATIASNTAVVAAASVKSNTVAVAVVRQVQTMQNTAPYQAELESAATAVVESNAVNQQNDNKP